jgi:hypothetical protein
MTIKTHATSNITLAVLFLGLCYIIFSAIDTQLMSPLARTLELLVRRPLKAWKSLYIYSVFVLGSGLAMG